MKIKRWDVSVLESKKVDQRHDADFFTTDTDAWVELNLVDSAIQPTTATVIAYNQEDHSLVEEVISVVDNLISFPLYNGDRSLIEHYGGWVIRAIFNYDGKKYTTRDVGVYVNSTEFDNIPSRLEIVENWNKIELEFEEMRQAEILRQDLYDEVKGKLAAGDFKGVRGDDGYTPVKGVDYFDGIDGDDGYTPVKGFDYFDGVDGKDGPEYIAGENITIDKDYVISASGGIDNIPIATRDVIGGIRARLRDASVDTEEVRIDGETGNLFVRPSEGGVEQGDVRVVAGRLQYFNGDVWYEITDSSGNVVPPTVFIEPSPAEWFKWQDVAGGVDCLGFANVEIAASTKAIKLPAEVDGKTVMNVAREAFTGGSLEMVDLSLISGGLDTFAFNDNNIHTVNISDVATLGYWCFQNNRISEVIMNDNTGSLLAGSSNFPVFDGNRVDPTKINWGNTTTIPPYLFMKAGIRGTLNLPVGLTSIGLNAFHNNSIVTLNLPDGLTSIAQSAFSYNSIVTIDLPVGLASIGIKSFERNSIRTLNLPDGLTGIGNYAFLDNSIVTLNLPGGLTSIGMFAFSGNLITTLNLPSGLTSLGQNAFENNSIATLVLPDSLVNIVYQTFNYQRPSIAPRKREIHYTGSAMTGGPVGPTIAGYKFNDEWEHIEKIDVVAVLNTMLGGAQDEIK